ncbi:MAG: hypothetical protein L0207_03250 [Chlamydiae bacterium]|nr:hypothetical protein [Chlamydiota bacterium]
MRARLFILFYFSILFFGCQKPNANENSSVESHPTTALIPLFDSSSHTLPWDVANELTYSIRQKLVKNGKLSLLNDSITSKVKKKLRETSNPLGVDSEFIKEHFKNKEILIFMELVYYRESLLDEQENAGMNHPSEIEIAVRVKVLDLRASQINILLQELVKHRAIVPRACLNKISNEISGDFEADFPNFSEDSIGETTDEEKFRTSDQKNRNIKENFIEIGSQKADMQQVWKETASSISPIDLVHKELAEIIAIKIEESILREEQ